MCGFRWLVRNSEKLLVTSSKIFGTFIVDSVLKATFFGHFCAGTDEASIRPSVERLRINGIGGILDYAAESDTKKQLPTSIVEKVQCRVYDYEDEIQCDKNVEIFLSCIRAVHNTTPEGFAAIKVTALGLPAILERMSTAILEIKKLFSKFDYDGNGKITPDEFQRALKELFRDFSENEISEKLNQKFHHSNGSIDYVEWTNTIRISEIWAMANRAKPGNLTSAVFNEDETKLMNNMISRINTLAEYAEKLGVRLMVDAEQTYFQPAIDHLVLDLQRKFNRNFPTIFNTYQCYLKDSYDRVATDLIRAKREGYFFAAKIVRGAYIILERKRAANMNYEDPIHLTLQDTHDNYHRVVDLILRDLHCSNVLVATHNQNSVSYVLDKMEKLNISPSNGGVYFGQLLGMADHLTFNLGRNGYKAYKYVPYGPVHEVLPYLIRRAQENSNVLGGTKQEIVMIKSEIKRRILFLS